jgi:hypothetical protein
MGLSPHLTPKAKVFPLTQKTKNLTTWEIILGIGAAAVTAFVWTDFGWSPELALFRVVVWLDRASTNPLTHSG